jgi:hypothetical protein
MPWANNIVPVLALFLAASVVMGCASAPRAMSQQAFAERVETHESQSLAQRDDIAQRLLRRLEYRHEERQKLGQADEPFTYEVLMLSSGGQFGAFGVGVLQGWSEVQNAAFQRPEFDLVTGVSTGALIAPFSLLGTVDSIRRIDQLYREASDQLATLRGLLFFLPQQPSFFDSQPLADRIASEIDLATVRGIADAHAEHRKLLLGSTDLDLGRFRIWDMGPRAVRALETQDLTEMHRIFLSSAAIPAAFPPVDIDGALYADGAVAQAAFVGLDREEIVQVFREFRARNPDAAMPKLRFWMIVNGFLDVDPELIGVSWVPVARRSTQVLTSYGMRVTLRHMQFGVELLAKDLDTQADFYYLAVPHDLELPAQTQRLFDPQVMQALAAEGRRLGQNPSSWRTDALAPEIPGSALRLNSVWPDTR